MKHQHFLIALLIILIFTSLISIADVVTKALFGYAGFQEINSYPEQIFVNSQCNNIYFTNKYNQFRTNLKISYITSLLVALSSLCALITTSILLIMLNQMKNRQDITDNRFIGNRYNEDVINYFLNKRNIVALYVLLFFGVISSYVSFHQVLQVIPERTFQLCTIDYENNGRLLMFILFSGVNLLLFLVAIILLIVLASGYNKYQEQVQFQNKSTSYRQEVNRIIQQIPSQERRLFKNNKQELKPQILYQKESEVEPYQFKQYKSFYKSDDNQEIRVQNLHKVESIIYKPSEPQLRLQSRIS